MPDSPKRVLVYSHDTYGIGNIRRTLEICRALSRTLPDVSILLITSSPHFNGFGKPDNVEVVKLPELKRSARGTYTPRIKGFQRNDVRRMREDLCLTAMSHFAPDLVLVDKGPFGVADELRPALLALENDRPQCVKVLALRDILDDAMVVREQFKANGHARQIVDHYHQVWVFGHRDLYDLELEYGLPPELVERLHYFGFIGRSETISSSDAVRARLGVGDGPMLLVTAGGGDDGEHLLTNFAAAIPALRERHGALANVVVTGPQSSENTRKVVDSACATDASSVHIEFSLDLVSVMAAADAVICMGGYNTVCEVVMLGKPATIVPRTEPVSEQLVRARLLSERGVVRLCEPREMTPERLVYEVDTMLNGWVPRPLGPEFTRFDAHERAATTAARLLADPPPAVRLASRSLHSSTARVLP